MKERNFKMHGSNIRAACFLLEREFGDQYEDLRAMFDAWRTPRLQTMRRSRHQGFAGYPDIRTWADKHADEFAELTGTKAKKPGAVLAVNVGYIFSPYTLAANKMDTAAQRSAFDQVFNCRYGLKGHAANPGWYRNKEFRAIYQPLKRKLTTWYLRELELNDFCCAATSASFFQGWQFHIPSIDKKPGTIYGEDDSEIRLVFSEINKLKGSDLDDAEVVELLLKYIVEPLTGDIIPVPALDPCEYGTTGRRLNPITQTIGHWAQSYREPGSVTTTQLYQLLEKNGIRCAVTGLPMEFTCMDPGKPRKWNTISLARIDHEDIHHKDNVIFVCSAVNTAMNNHWEIEEFRAFCKVLLDAYNSRK